MKINNIADLKPDKKNANKGTQRGRGMVEASLRETGAGRSILVDKDGRIIAGNKTLEAWADIASPDDVVIVPTDGKKLVVVQRQDLDLNDDTGMARKLAFYDNRAGEVGLEWDADELLASMQNGLDLSAFWNQDELDALLEGMNDDESANAGADTEPQIDKSEELRAKWNVELGQMWQLGDHRIICGDCTGPATVARVMGGEKASIVFTDPPYGVSIGAKNRMLNSFQPFGRNLTDIEDDSATPEELKERLLPAFINIRKMVMADDCTVFLTAPQGGELGMMMMMMKEAELPIRHVLIWKKNAPTFSMGRLDYDYQHEPILLTWGKRHKRPMLGTHKTSVWEIDKPRASAEHPTMKPVALYENAYRNNSDSGDIAYEPYSGSGTAIVACQNLGRKCRAIEISPGYVAVAIQRFFDHTGIQPVLID